MSKEHWSPTQLDLLCRCGEAYRRRYVEGEIVPPGIAAHRGTGVHEAAADRLRRIKDAGAAPSTDELVDAAVSAFDTALNQRGATLTSAEDARGVAIVIGESRDEVVRMARAHAELVAPHYMAPQLVEEPVRIELTGERDLFGVIDLVDGDPDGLLRVVDFKTSRRRKAQSDADQSTQLTFYAAATRMLFPDAVDPTVRLDVLVSGREVTRQVLDSTRDGEDFAALRRRIDVAEAAIRAGLFLPATPGAWWCSEDWCGYFRTCPYVRSSR